MKKEAEFTSKFRHWARRNLATCAFECKHTRGEGYFLVRELKEHQLWALLAVADGSFAYKIPDDGVSHKPFDGFVMRGDPAWVVICFPDQFMLIDARRFVGLKGRLHFEKAANMASIIRKLGDLQSGGTGHSLLERPI